MPTKAIRSRRLTPAALLAVAVRELKRRGSPERAAGGKAYFKKSEPVHLYGVPVPQVRALARTLLADVRSTWTVADAIGFANLAVKKCSKCCEGPGFPFLPSNGRQRTLASNCGVMAASWNGRASHRNWRSSCRSGWNHLCCRPVRVIRLGYRLPQKGL